MAAFVVVWYSDFSLNFYGDMKMFFWSIISVVIACVGLYFGWVGLCLNATANQAKLQATEALYYWKELPEKPVGIQIKIKNTGSKKVTIKHIEMCRVKKRGMTLCGRKREYVACKAVYSSRKDEEPFKDSGFYESEVMDLASLEIHNPNELDVGKSCTRLVHWFEAEGHSADLAELAASKKEAKDVQFVVCTDYEKFPVKPAKSVKEVFVQKTLFPKFFV